MELYNGAAPALLNFLLGRLLRAVAAITGRLRTVTALVTRRLLLSGVFFLFLLYCFDLVKLCFVGGQLKGLLTT